MSWAAVATVAEPAPLVLAFVAHTLEAGAAEVQLFLDAPDPDLTDALSGMPQVRVEVCDDAYWRAATGTRPWIVADRQKANLGRAYAAARHPWLLHIDADEFLVGPPDLEAGLARADDRVDFAHVTAFERVHSGRVGGQSVFEGVFRRPCTPDLAPTVAGIDGPAAPFLSRGMAAYAGGKSFFRTGRNLKLGVHAPFGEGPGRMLRLPDHAILHFDGLTPALWSEKKLRKTAQQPGWLALPESHAFTRNQLEAARTARGDRAKVEEIYGRLKVLDPRREAALRDLGLIAEFDLRIEETAQRVFPGRALDFSAAAFDAMGLRVRPRRDLQTVKHGLRALGARLTGRRPKA